MQAVTRQQPQKVEIEWAEQDRQMDFLRACGLSYPWEGGEPEDPVADVIFYGGAAGGGKGQPADGLVATPYGLRKMGDIAVGDRVCSPTHGNSQVIKKTDLGVVATYRVRFADGTSLVVTGDHLWKVSRVRGGKDKRGLRYRLMTTEQIAEYLDDGYYDLQVPLPDKPVQFTKSYRYPHRDIDPYVLGVLLGDGSITQRAKFTTTDEGILSEVKKRAGYVKDYSHGDEYGLSSEHKEHLDNLNLLGTNSNTKFIPEPYLFWSINKRFDLVRGLMDTDGYVDERGHVGYTTVSPQLAEDVAFLVRSLGYRVTVSQPQPSYCNGERKQDKYRLYIQGSHKQLLFSLIRKANRCEDPRYKVHKKIVAVAEGERQQSYCITVDNPNGLYIAGEDLIVTHNSDALLMGGILACVTYPGCVVAYFRRQYTDLEGPGGIIHRSRQLIPETLAKYNAQQRRWTFHNGSILEFCHAKREEDVYNYQSQQFDVLLIDEATHFTEFQYRYLITRNRATVDGIKPFCGLASNPGNVGHGWANAQFITVGPPDEVHEVEVEEVAEADVKITEKHIFLPAKLEDNQILEMRDPDYRRRLLSQPEHLRRMLLYGDWEAFTGQAFREFDPDIHVVDMRPEEIPPWWEKWRANDLGFTDPFVWLWFAIDQDGIVYVYREFTRDRKSEQLTYSEQGRRVAEMSRVVDPKTGAEREEDILFTVSGHDAFNTDPETGKAPIDYYEEGGVSGFIRPPKGSGRDRKFGAAAVHEYLQPYFDENDEKKKAKLQICSNCEYLIKTLPQLSIDDRDPEKVAVGPDDHAYDALRYGLVAWHVDYSDAPEEEKSLIERHKDRMARELKYSRRGYEMGPSKRRSRRYF